MDYLGFNTFQVQEIDYVNPFSKKDLLPNTIVAQDTKGETTHIFGKSVEGIVIY